MANTTQRDMESEIERERTFVFIFSRCIEKPDVHAVGCCRPFVRLRPRVCECVFCIAIGSAAATAAAEDFSVRALAHETAVVKQHSGQNSGDPWEGKARDPAKREQEQTQTSRRRRPRPSITARLKKMPGTSHEVEDSAKARVAQEPFRLRQQQRGLVAKSEPKEPSVEGIGDRFLIIIEGIGVEFRKSKDVS